MIAILPILLVSAAAGLLVSALFDIARRNDVATMLSERVRGDLTSRLGKKRFGSILRRFGKDKGKVPDIEIERALVELIDVLKLGMESGLSFEHAFSIYAMRFDSTLACECRRTAMLMTSGVTYRDETMEELARKIGNRDFTRFVRISLRSVRYGSKLLPMLDGLSQDVRRECRNTMEEKVSKAPTKMLVPTGVLILPAMLMLVCGPFLIELMGQL